MKPIILLSRPTLSQNIGACARAMMNFGLTDMRLIDPQADWLNANARALSADADPILESAQKFSNIEEALHDLHHVYATTARPRDMIKDVVTPKELAAEVYAHKKANKKVGILMGSEKSGLENDEIALCDKIVTIPLNPDFSSINLAQATILVAYELFQFNHETHGNPETKHQNHNTQKTETLINTRETEQESAWTKTWAKSNISEHDIAPRTDLFGFFHHLESELEKKNYYRCADKRPIMDRNLRNMFARANFTTQEIRTLRGVISTLTSTFDDEIKN